MHAEAWRYGCPFSPAAPVLHSPPPPLHVLPAARGCRRKAAECLAAAGAWPLLLAPHGGTAVLLPATYAWLPVRRPCAVRPNSATLLPQLAPASRSPSASLPAASLHTRSPAWASLRCPRAAPPPHGQPASSSQPAAAAAAAAHRRDGSTGCTSATRRRPAVPLPFGPSLPLSLPPSPTRRQTHQTRPPPAGAALPACVASSCAYTQAVTTERKKRQLTAELLLQLPHQALLDLVVGLEQAVGNADEDGLAGGGDVHLLCRGREGGGEGGREEGGRRRVRGRGRRQRSRGRGPATLPAPSWRRAAQRKTPHQHRPLLPSGGAVLRWPPAAAAASEGPCPPPCRQPRQTTQQESAPARRRSTDPAGRSSAPRWWPPGRTGPASNRRNRREQGRREEGKKAGRGQTIGCGMWAGGQPAGPASGRAWIQGAAAGCGCRQRCEEAPGCGAAGLGGLRRAGLLVDSCCAAGGAARSSRWRNASQPSCWWPPKLQHQHPSSSASASASLLPIS